MTTALLVVLVVSLAALFIIAKRSLNLGRVIAALKQRPLPEPVWMGVEKRGHRLFRSRFRYNRPGPRVPGLADRLFIHPLRALWAWITDVVPEVTWATR